MKNITITLYEDRKTLIDINEKQQRDIMELRKLWEPQNFIYQVDSSILLKHYVGFVANKQVKLQILPKIFEENSGMDSLDKKDEAIKILLRLLYYSGYIKTKEIPSPQNIKNYKSDLFEIFISIFIKRFFKLFFRDVHRKYEKAISNTQFIKGKILFSETLRKNSYYKHLHYVQYDEFTMNTILNKIIKTTMIYLLSQSLSMENKKELKKALIYLEDVDRIRLSEIAFKKVTFNRLNHDYQPLFNMAKMFYYNLKPGFYEGDQKTFTFLVPLYNLFEKFVYQLLHKHYINNSQKEVLYQKPEHYLAVKDDSKKFKLKPDITIRENNKVKVILDAKYKNPNKKILPSDVYQMLAYATAYKCKELYLVYPAFHKMKSPVEIRDTFIINTDFDDICLHVVQIDLRENNIESVQNELGSIISDDNNIL
ncbi:MAG: McrC family protein [bacterium]